MVCFHRYFAVFLSMLKSISTFALRPQWSPRSFVKAISSKPLLRHTPTTCKVNKLMLSTSYIHAYTIQPGITVSKAHADASTWLAQCGIDEADDSVRHMICHVTNIGTRYSDFNRNLDRTITPEEAQQLSKMCIQRAEHVPVQYIIGNWDFFGLTFRCKPPILIPRPETEELVEKILHTNALQAMKAPRILDVGAGTGAIGIALASQLKHAVCCSIDINPDAVTLANSNAHAILGEGYQQRYNSIHADLRTYAMTMGKALQLEANQHSAQQTQELPRPTQFTVNGVTVASNLLQTFDLIVSNPPYIPTTVINTLQPEIRHYEDSIALDGGLTGLDIVKDLILLAPILLKPRSLGGTGELWIEVSEEHPVQLRHWMVSGYESERSQFVDRWCAETGMCRELLLRCKAAYVEGIVDLSGNPRFVRFRFSG